MSNDIVNYCFGVDITATEEPLNETASRFIQSAEQLPDLKNDIASGQRLHMIIKARRLLSAAPYKA